MRPLNPTTPPLSPPTPRAAIGRSPRVQGEPRKARGETGKRMGAEDEDETGCCGPSDVLKEIEIENEIYKK